MQGQYSWKEMCDTIATNRTIWRSKEHWTKLEMWDRCLTHSLHWRTSYILSITALQPNTTWLHHRNRTPLKPECVQEALPVTVNIMNSKWPPFGHLCTKSPVWCKGMPDSVKKLELCAPSWNNFRISVLRTRGQTMERPWLRLFSCTIPNLQVLHWDLG